MLYIREGDQQKNAPSFHMYIYVERTLEQIYLHYLNENKNPTTYEGASHTSAPHFHRAHMAHFDLAQKVYVHIK